jgi:hypothetical protein
MTKHVHKTWYRLLDGTQADPNDVAPDDRGVLRHKNGLAVAVHSDGTPVSVGIDDQEPPQSQVDAAVAAQATFEQEVKADELAAQPVKADDAKAPATKQVEAEPAKNYKTREAKGR